MGTYYDNQTGYTSALQDFTHLCIPRQWLCPVPIVVYSFFWVRVTTKYLYCGLLVLNLIWDRMWPQFWNRLLNTQASRYNFWWNWLVTVLCFKVLEPMFCSECHAGCCVQLTTDKHTVYISIAHSWCVTTLPIVAMVIFSYVHNFTTLSNMYMVHV